MVIRSNVEILAAQLNFGIPLSEAFTERRLCRYMLGPFFSALTLNASVDYILNERNDETNHNRRLAVFVSVEYNARDVILA